MDACQVLQTQSYNYADFVKVLKGRNSKPITDGMLFQVDNIETEDFQPTTDPIEDVADAI